MENVLPSESRTISWVSIFRWKDLKSVFSNVLQDDDFASFDKIHQQALDEKQRSRFVSHVSLMEKNMKDLGMFRSW